MGVTARARPGTPSDTGTITARYMGWKQQQMIILGLLLILATVGLTLAVILINDSILTSPATAIELFGNQAHITVGQVFLAGAAAGALVMLGLVMFISGLGRNARRRSTARHQLRDHRQEMQDLKRMNDTTATELAAHRAATGAAAESDGITRR